MNRILISRQRQDRVFIRVAIIRNRRNFRIVQRPIHIPFHRIQTEQILIDSRRISKINAIIRISICRQHGFLTKGIQTQQVLIHRSCVGKVNTAVKVCVTFERHNNFVTVPGIDFEPMPACLFIYHSRVQTLCCTVLTNDHSNAGLIRCNIEPILACRPLRRKNRSSGALRRIRCRNRYCITCRKRRRNHAQTQSHYCHKCRTTAGNT